MKQTQDIICLSIVIPCYNEEKTLARCVARLLDIQGEKLSLDIIIVDDASTDRSACIAQGLARKYANISLIKHHRNQGKGAALRTGFKAAAGQFTAVQDADLEYDPKDLVRLMEPLIHDEADVVIGSRFLSTGKHRVLYFWHYVGNRILTLLSNMFTDLNLTDMEAGYKVFRTNVIRDIHISENRFGFEPEIVAKIARKRLRIYEMGISYHGRTYAEGKKINWKDGIRALYCIFRYNAHQAPLPMQLLIYVFIGGFCAAINLVIFLSLHSFRIPAVVAAPLAFFFAAGVNYILCVILLFRHNARWNSTAELVIYLLVVCAVAACDLIVTSSLLSMGISAGFSKAWATLCGLMLNFLGRRLLVFPEPASGPWRAQNEPKNRSENEKPSPGCPDSSGKMAVEPNEH